MSPSTFARVLPVVVIATVLLAGAVAGTAAAGGTSLATANETVRVHGTADATVGGNTTLDTGRELTVRIRSTAETNPRFFKSNTTTVEQDGRFAVEFDLSDYSAGDTFTVAVLHNGSRVAEADGRVVAPDVPTTMAGATTATTPDDGTTGSGTAGSTATGTDTATPIPGFGPVASALGIATGVGILRRRA